MEKKLYVALGIRFAPKARTGGEPTETGIGGGRQAVVEETGRPWELAAAERPLLPGAVPDEA